MKKIVFRNCIYFFVFTLILFSFTKLYDRYFGKNNVYARETNATLESIKISNAKKINFDEIVVIDDTNLNQEENIIEEVDLEYITKYRNNSKLPQNTMQVVQEGRTGKQEITYKKIYENGKLIGKEQIAIKVTKAAIDKIIELGTGENVINKQAAIGDSVYVTSDRLGVMSDNNENSQKLATLKKGEKIKIIEIKDDWYKVTYGGQTGYVNSEATKTTTGEKSSSDTIKGMKSNKNKKVEIEENERSQEEINMANLDLSFDMLLNKPTGLSIEQFKKVLTDTKDINKIFENNSDYFYYIEKQYNINGIFVASIGIHESAWGTSQIARNKNNLFGYGAYDSNPYNGAYSFSNYSESIDLLARVLVKYYLNPNGTSIYDGQKAIGTYYNGATLTGVNTRYASDKQWANKVYTYIKYLYNKL